MNLKQNEKELKIGGIRFALIHQKQITTKSIMNAHCSYETKVSTLKCMHNKKNSL